MRKTLLVLAVTALVGLGFATPDAAKAYRTFMCEDNGFPREFGVQESPGRTFFVGTEHTTPVHDPNIVAGTRLCVEVNNPGGSNIVGIDVGWGLWTTPMLSGPGFAVFLDVCGHPTETTCTTVVQPTGADVTPGDGPDTNPFTTTCIATVASLCIGAPLLEYGKSGDPTVVVVVNGTPIPVNLTYNCVTVPGVPCP